MALIVIVIADVGDQANVSVSSEPGLNPHHPPADMTPAMQCAMTMMGALEAKVTQVEEGKKEKPRIQLLDS